MFGYFLRRLAGGALTVFAIATLSFAVTRIAPGSPFSTERAMHPEVLKNFEAYYGLDKPVIVQYGRTMWRLLQLDLGPSMYYRDQTCGNIVWPGLRKSIVLGGISGLIALSFGVSLGLIGAARQNHLSDHLAMSVSTLGICVPNFVLGPLLILLFSTTLHWLPTARWPEDGSWHELSKLVMPSITLALVHVAYSSRLGRAGMLEVMNKDFIRTARAKGLSETAVFLKHGLKNGITPVISYAGPMWAVIITGSVVVEQVFAIPGLGQQFVKSALNRDMNLIMACVLVYSTIVIFFNFLVDVAYALLDPRVRLQ